MLLMVTVAAAVAVVALTDRNRFETSPAAKLKAALQERSTIRPRQWRSR